MKKLLKYIWALPALLLVSCSEELLTENEVADQGVLVTVNMPTANQSRVALDGPTGDLTWQGDEYLYTYKVDEKGDAILEGFDNKGKIVGTPKGKQAVFYLGGIPENDNEEVWIASAPMNQEVSKTGLREDFNQTSFVQEGNNNTSHLIGRYGTSYIQIGGKFTAGEVRSGNITLQPLCCLATFTIESYPEEIGKIQSITWIVNHGNIAKRFERTLTLTNVTDGKIVGYMLFYPDEVQLEPNGEMVVLLTGKNGTKAVTATSTNGKVYEVGHRYNVTMSTEPGEGVLSNWTDINTNIAAKGEIWVKASGEIKINPDLADANDWEVATPTTEIPYYRIYKKGHTSSNPIEFTKILDGTLLDGPSIVALQEIYFPEGLETIGARVFSKDDQYRPYDLTKIQLSSTIKTIGFAAFTGCESLTTIALNKNMTLECGAFLNHSIPVIVLPEGTTDNGGAFEKKNNQSVDEYVLNNNCKVIDLSQNPRGAYYSGLIFKKITVKPGAAVTLGKGSFAGTEWTFYRLETFQFTGTIASSIHPDFMKDGGDPSLTYKTNLILNVDWLNPGDDSNAEYLKDGANAALRTPKPIYDTVDTQKITGGTWMGYTWKSITFVNSDGSAITNPSTYDGLKGSAVWGDPNAVVK